MAGTASTMPWDDPAEHPPVGHQEIDDAGRADRDRVRRHRRQSKDADQPGHQQRVSGDGDQPVGKVKSKQPALEHRRQDGLRPRSSDRSTSTARARGSCEGRRVPRRPEWPAARSSGKRGQHRSAAICTRKPRTPTATKGATRVAAVDLMPFLRADAAGAASRCVSCRRRAPAASATAPAGRARAHSGPRR